MKQFLLSITLFLLPLTGLAAPAYSRSVELGAIQTSQAVVLPLPADITTYTTGDTIRILEENQPIAFTINQAKAGTLQGSIASIQTCSLDAGATTQTLYDGATTTFAQPDALQNPTSCIFTINFVTDVRVNGIQFVQGQSLKKLQIAAQTSNDTYTTIHMQENATSTKFSELTTKSLRITADYTIAPQIKEIVVEGVQPAKLLFLADPAKTYTVVYGGTNPVPMPTSTQQLTSTISTPVVSLSATVRTDESVRTDDKDYDGIADTQDNCPTVFNPLQRDDDVNGIGYECDDADKDGIVNPKDNCPGTANRDQLDSDGNGIGDVCELDRDGDGIPDTQDNCRAMNNSDQADQDQDNIGDACDSCPALKNSDQKDTNNNGIGDACEAAIQDPDGDGINNVDDNCPSVSNANQADTDNDGIGNACDNCPTIQNKNQADSDKNGQGDACTDADLDGLLPYQDNCPTITNDDQLDTDNDGLGNACEDDDGDGIVNAKDNCPQKSNYNQADADNDGIGNVCDPDDSRFSEQHPWVLWIGLLAIIGVLMGIAVRFIKQVQADRLAQ